MWLNKLCTKGYEFIRHFSNLFDLFLSSYFFLLAKLPMPYLKSYTRLVTYQKSEKSDVRLPRRARKRIFFHTFFAIFRPKKIYSYKTAYAIFEVIYKAKVSYQKSEKSYDFLPKNAWRCIFFTPFPPFLANLFFFFENPAPSVFRSSKKLPCYQKSENSNEPFEWNLPD